MAKLVELRAVAGTDVLVPAACGVALLAASTAGALDGPAPPLLWLGLAGLALAVAACLDDPAAPMTGSVPTSLRRRVLQRLTVPAVLVTVWGGCAALADGHRELSGPHLFLTGAGVLAAVTAASAVLRRLGHTQPGPTVGPAALLLLVGCMLFQPIAGHVVLQAYAEQATPGPWSAVVAVSALALWWASADPGGRGYIRPTRLRLRPGKTVAVEAPKRASTTSASTLR